MGIGTSKGAFHEDEFRYEAAPWFIDPKMEEKDNNVIDPDLNTGPKELKNPVIKAGAFLGNAPVEGTPEYDEWGKTWSEIHPLRNGDTPEKFMQRIPDPDTEGVFDSAPTRNWMMLRKKIKPSLKLEDAISDAGGLVHLASNVTPLRSAANDNIKGLQDSAGNLIGGLDEDELMRSWNALRDEMRPKPFLVPGPDATKPK